MTDKYVNVSVIGALSFKTCSHVDTPWRMLTALMLVVRNSGLCLVITIVVVIPYNIYMCVLCFLLTYINTNWNAVVPICSD